MKLKDVKDKIDLYFANTSSKELLNKAKKYKLIK